MDKVKQYYNTKAVSNSLLGTLTNPRWIKFQMDNPDAETGEKSFFRIGSALDCLLTDPERWEKDFMVIEATRPFGLMSKFIDALPEGLHIGSSKQLFQNAYEESGYKMKLETVISKFWENTDAVNYYTLTRNLPSNVSVLSRDEYDMVLKCKDLILENPFTYKYFVKTEIYHEIMKQVPIYFRYRDTDCKALLDGILIDHQNKTILPYDLKTTGRTTQEFPNSYLTYGYYRQCAFYEQALLSDESPIKDLLEEGYQLLDFEFIVVDTRKSSQFPAIIFKTNSNDRKCGIEGGHLGKKYYKGINELIDAYKYHIENDYWDLPLDVFLNSGKIDLQIFDDNTTEYELLDLDSPDQ